MLCDPNSQKLEILWCAKSVLDVAGDLNFADGRNSPANVPNVLHAVLLYMVYECDHFCLTISVDIMKCNIVPLCR